MDFIRKGSADLYHSATPRLYKEQPSPMSVTVGLLLTSTFISHSQLPSHTTSTTCYFTLKQHSATEVYLPKELKGKRRMTWTQDGWAAWGLTIMEQCSYKPVPIYYIPQCVSFGVVRMGFSSVISFCLKLLSSPLCDEKWIWPTTAEWNKRKLKESEGDSTCFSLPEGTHD